MLNFPPMLPRIPRLVAAIPLALLLTASPVAAVDFSRDIRPILNKNCAGCHGGVKQAGGISFVYRDQVIGFEGDSGNPVVVPGDLDASELVYRITTDDDIDRMPPTDEHPEGLKAEEVALLKKWVKAGAPWEPHWSFVEPERASLPSVRDSAWPLSRMDHFTLAAMETRGLEPNRPAEPARLLRRLHLDLTGLPPTLEDYDAFETAWRDDPDAAVRTAVDDLLQRPAFGERWATLWLDLVRYADSRGLGLDDRRTIWKYRDWVIDAFASDMPFDEFTIAQLAGDLLPEPTTADLIATACHRNTQTNNEGGTDDEEFRTEAVLDRVNTTWQAWNAISFGCVQCHSHPYDPLRHEEYYGFMAFFNNTADSDLANDEPLLRVPLNPDDQPKSFELDQRILNLKQRMWEPGNALRQATAWEPVRDLEARASNETRLAIETVDDREEFHTVGTVQKELGVTLTAPVPAGQPLTAIRLTALPLDPETALRDPEWGFLIHELEAHVHPSDNGESGSAEPRAVSFRRALPDVPWRPEEPFASIKPNGVGFAAFTRIHHPRELVLVPERPMEIEPGSRLSFRVKCNRSARGSFPLVIKRGRLDLSRDPAWTEWAKSPALAEADRELASLMDQRKAIPATTVPILSERPDSIARPTHVFARGNFLTKDKQVTEMVPASLPPIESASPEGPSRLDLARWLVSPDHPLTARVFVNRIWEQLFGAGIVPTLEDFGSAGEPPTHPELLDDLAVRFVEDFDWSVKALIREIVLSATYRQSARASAAKREIDPSNQWLARGPRNRLTAEMVRDQSLALAGLLSSNRGGPPVHPPLPDGVWKPFYRGDKWKTPGPDDENRYRRAIYTYVKRTIPYPAFSTFDAPSREFCTSRRLTSNTPLQALVTLNDQGFLEAAQGLANRMHREFEGPPEARIATAYRLSTGTRPGETEMAELLSLFESTRQAHLQDPDPSDSVADEPVRFAYTIVAQVLLNLDEVLTR